MKFMVSVIVAMLTSCAFALAEYVDGVRWVYMIQNGCAIVGMSGETAVSSSYKGILQIPQTLGGCSVVGICDSAFRDCSGITQVTMPNSITHIGSNAFRGCSSLVNVMIPDNVKDINRNTFSFCDALSSVSIGSGVTNIATSAFGFCYNLATFEVAAANLCYKSCAGLLLTKDGKSLVHGINGDVDMPEGIMNIGQSAFSCCTNITRLVFPSTVTNIGDGAFYNCNTLPMVECVIPENVISIGERAFGNCFGPTNVTISSAVESIGTGAFSFATLMAYNVAEENCNYKSLNGLLLTKDGKALTGGTNGDVVIPDGVETIMDGAFSGCANLTNVLIPDSVTNIGVSAFYNCRSLPCVIVPSSVASIGGSSFNGCAGLKSIVFMGDAPTVYEIFEGVASDCSAYIRRGSSGWGVGVPGTWHGIAIDYIHHTVVLDPNGGTCDIISLDVPDGETIGELPEPERSDATFIGWFTSLGDAINALTVITDVMTIYAHWIIRVHAPSIKPNGLTFLNASQTVELSCTTDGAVIYYTTDGRDPKKYGLEYTRPFAIFKSCQIRAIAVKHDMSDLTCDWKDSAEVSATFTRSEVLSEAANFYGYTMETGEGAQWSVDAAVSHDGVSSIRSNGSGSYVQSSVRGAGTLSFWWRAQCEEPEDGEYYDYGIFKVGSVESARIAGNDTGWVFFSTNITTTGKHTLRWEYCKDDEGTYQPDCVWVDQVQWVPADGSGYTLTTPEPVPYSWLTKYNLGVAEGDFEAAANAPNGKTSWGRPMAVWQDYVAGTDPTNIESRLQAYIEMQGDYPLVTWDPNLNTNGIVRVYKVYGSETLDSGGNWQYPTNALHRFFKVKVEMP